MMPNHGEVAGDVRVLIVRVGVQPWEIWLRAAPHPFLLEPWELQVLRAGSSRVVSTRRFASRRAARAARRRLLDAIAVAGSPVETNTIEAVLDGR